MADGRLSQFKATLARKKEREFKKQRKFDRTKLGFKSSDSKLKNDAPKLSESELEAVKNRFRKKIKSDRRREMTITLIVTGVLAILILFLMLK